ncbi:hypothetical protein WME75_45135 [Sorangium sp. So ce1014]|uniref:hypothetical protein n=1 Tax=Sorangium sp. So ce1014 TaxID=3133326 RepID=UPI003F5EDE85
MHKTALALWISAVCLSLGCGSNNSDIAGKAVVDVRGKQLVLDTGNDGRDVVNEYDRWGTICGVEDGMQEVFLDDKNRSDGFVSILIYDRSTDTNVYVLADGYDYTGICSVTVKVTSNDPYEADFSVAPCDLGRAFDDAPARLVSASFRVASCEYDGPGG